jgi:hypothetical protein
MRKQKIENRDNIVLGWSSNVTFLLVPNNPMHSDYKSISIFLYIRIFT